MNNSKAEVYFNDNLAGYLVKVNDKYIFKYVEAYVKDKNSPPISLTLPKRLKPFISEFLFPFFFGLLSEGENKKLQCEKLRIDEKDYFTRLLKTAENNTIGAITVIEV